MTKEELKIETLKQTIVDLKDMLDSDYKCNIINASNHCTIDSWLDDKLRYLGYMKDNIKRVEI